MLCVCGGSLAGCVDIMLLLGFFPSFMCLSVLLNVSFLFFIYSFIEFY